MPNNSQVLRIKVEQYNKVLEVLTEPMTLNEISQTIGVDDALIQYYMEKLLKNSFKNGMPILTRYKCEQKRTKKNMVQYAYVRHVSEITLDDLVDPVIIEKYRQELEEKNMLSKRGKVLNDEGEVTVSHIRSFNLLSDPTEQQLKALQAADQARREDNRKKKHRVHIGGMYSLMGYA